MSDTMVEVKVDVTAEDIAKGKRGSCGGCPVAIATKRATGLDAALCCGVSIDLYVSEVKVWSTPTPDAAFGFMEAFDIGEPVGPINFPLPVPADLVRSA